MYGYVVWAAILLMDPVAILSQSLALCRCGRGIDILASVASCPEWQPPPVLRAVVSLIHLQLGITLLLMPVQIVIFHGISDLVYCKSISNSLGHLSRFR